MPVGATLARRSGLGAYASDVRAGLSFTLRDRFVSRLLLVHWFALFKALTARTIAGQPADDAQMTARLAEWYGA